MVDITSDCTLGTENRTICMATLQMDYYNNSLSVIFDGLSQNSWNVSEETRIITHNMQISFDTLKLKRIIQVYCFDNNSCVQDIRRIISTISFPQVHPSRIISLREELQLKLYNSSNSNDLLCENNQNETIPCPNGFCQLIDNGEFGFTRNCIPEDSSMFSPSILIGSSMDITTISFQSMCLNSSGCVEDVNTTYNMMKTFKHDEFRGKLRERLYFSNPYVHDLTCSNNQDESVPCPNGFCRLIRGDESHVDRSCVSQGLGINPSGIFIQSNTEGRSNTTTIFTYACNKPMCNGAETDAYVKQLIDEYELSSIVLATTAETTKTVTPSTTITVTTSRTVTTTTKPMVTTTEKPAVVTPLATNKPATITTEDSTTTTTPESNAALGILYVTCMNFQWILPLVITILSQI
ncbi:unnamed protein product [Adineta steineri]|uniref:Uncharacterized protein n=1 Tax=Adineta steineri TaxID=433720 RepID=A0A815W877_9BILA|nr:unnamed protein product [Adineta steineri]CAF1541570.1 unnamed protein product [Adineta steineri]